MQGYEEIQNQKQMDALLDLVHGFHDSMTKEIHLVNRNYVDVEGSMSQGGRLDARNLFQSQYDPPNAVELLLVGIEEISLDPPAEYQDAKGMVIQEEVRHVKQYVDMTFDLGSLHVKADRLFYRVRTKWLGQETRFKGPVPCPEAIAALVIGDGWRQCSECCNAWEDDPGQVFSVCPECGAMTELHEKSSP